MPRRYYSLLEKKVTAAGPHILEYGPQGTPVLNALADVIVSACFLHHPTDPQVDATLE